MRLAIVVLAAALSQPATALRLPPFFPLRLQPLRMMAGDTTYKSELIDSIYDDSAEEDWMTPSSTRIPVDEDGEPTLARYTYVDEHSCIGCTYCAAVARSTTHSPSGLQWLGTAWPHSERRE